MAVTIPGIGNIETIDGNISPIDDPINEGVFDEVDVTDPVGQEPNDVRGRRPSGDIMRLLGLNPRMLDQLGLESGEGPGQSDFLRDIIGLQGLSQFLNQAPVNTGLNNILGEGLGTNPFSNLNTQQGFVPNTGNVGNIGPPVLNQGQQFQNDPTLQEKANALAFQGQQTFNDPTSGVPVFNNTAGRVGQFDAPQIADEQLAQAIWHASNNLSNVPSASDLFGLQSGDVIGAINENAAARGAFGGSVNQSDLVRGLGDLNLQSQLTAQNLRNQAIGNVLGTQGRSFGQAANTFGINQGAQQQQFGQDLSGFGAGLQAQGQQFGQGLQRFGANQGANQQAFNQLSGS